jgi:hypothetical protein
MAKRIRPDTYLRRGMLALVPPLGFLALELSWWALGPAAWEAFWASLGDVVALEILVVAAVMVLPLFASACGLAVLQSGRRNRAGAALALGAFVVLVLIALLRPS